MEQIHSMTFIENGLQQAPKSLWERVWAVFNKWLSGKWAFGHFIENGLQQAPKPLWERVWPVFNKWLSGKWAFGRFIENGLQ